MRLAFGCLTLCVVLHGGARAQSPDSMASMAGMAAEHAMSDPMVADPHMEMTPSRPPQPGDSARAAVLLEEMRKDLARFQDVNVATALGYRRFLPRVKHQPVYHYTNWVNALAERSRFDPAKPTSLLYREDASGHLVLIGAMYAEATGASLDDLDARIPLSIAHWHRHVNWCLPPLGARDRWTEVKDGHPVFGPKSPIATREACDAVGGRFRPRIFGWMVHVNAFSQNANEVWGEHHRGTLE